MSPEVYAAIRAHLTAVWAECPIAWENERFDRPETPSPWIIFELMANSYSQESIGADPQAENRWEEDGQAWFHVMVPNGWGSMEARRLSKAMANVFRGLTLIGGALEFLEATSAGGGPADEEGPYWRLSMSQQWRLFDTQT